MPNPRMKQRRVVHKSTAGILKPIPEAVDLVGNPPPRLTTKTVAPLHRSLPRDIGFVCAEAPSQPFFARLASRPLWSRSVLATYLPAPINPAIILKNARPFLASSAVGTGLLEVTLQVVARRARAEPRRGLRSYNAAGACGEDNRETLHCNSLAPQALEIYKWDRRFAVPRCWSRGDSNCRSVLVLLLLERPFENDSFSARPLK